MGISVSRVGGNAQIKPMKKVAGTLKIAQAQFRELESFTKFGGDIDPVTAKVIDTGRKNQQLLIQPQYSPWPVENQVAVIYCGVNGLMEDVPVESVKEFERQFVELVKAKYQKEVLDAIKGGQLTPEVEQKIRECAAEVSARFRKAGK